jgi:SNF2 family DNA or RNA helicase
MDAAAEHDTHAAAVEDLARYFVDSGRVVPGIVTEAAGTRSWWWPLPAASDRELLKSLLNGSTLDDHRELASGLAVSVDALMRERLSGVNVTAGKPAKNSIPDQWLASLTSAKPFLPKTLPAQKLLAFVESVQAWVASGVPSSARLRIVLRIEEPTSDQCEWCVRLLLQDTEEPSLIVDAESVWAGTANLGPTAVADLLTGLGRLTQLAPELRGLRDMARPASIMLDTPEVMGLMSERVSALMDAGIGVTMPAWWSTRHRVRLRAKATTKRSSTSSGSVGSSGFGFSELVSFTWEAALGGRKLTKAELASLTKAAASKQNLVRVRGEWVELDPAELAAMIAAVGTKGEAKAGDLIRTAMGLGGIENPAGANAIEVESTGWLGELLDGALHTTIEPVDAPLGFQGTLRAYQARGVGWLVFLGRLGLGACLADDMGLGKTAQLIGTLLADPIPEPTLVVCPVSVLGNWQRELERFAPHLRVKVHYGADRLRAGDQPFAERAEADVVLTSYSIVARDTDVLAEVPWGRLVLDEAQQVKNPGTAQTKAIRRIEASRRIALTGTPVENRLSELWSLMHVLNPGLLGTASDFKRRFAVPIEVDHDDAATELLRKITGPFVLRRLKSDRSIINDLPDKIEQTETCALTREQATLYQAIVDDLLEKADDAEGIGRRGLVLAGITKLKQVCNHPAHFARDGSPLAARSGKLNRVEELLDEIVDAGDQVLCFTQFAEWGELLVPHLTRRYGESPLWLHGGTPRKKRDEMVDQFGTGDGPRIFLLSLKAGGTGLNLTPASHVIHLDRWWNPAVEDQATDRAYRIGQKRTVLVHKLVSAGTVEERIDAMINSKRTLAASVVGTGEEWITELSTDELRDVISLRESAMIGSE